MKRGFTLVELLVVIGLLGVLLTALASVSLASARQTKGIALHDDSAAVKDRVVKMLRRDMWKAEGAALTNKETWWIGRSDGETNEKYHTVTWEITGNQRTLRRTAHFWHGDTQAHEPPVLESETREDFLLNVPVSFESASEKFVNPMCWSGPGPIPHAIRLHLGDEDFYLPNRGVFTYGFACGSGRIYGNSRPIPEIAP